MTTTAITTLLFNFVFFSSFLAFYCFFLKKEKMDHVLLHIPRIVTLQLKDIFYKEEELKNSNGKFCFKVWTPEFFKRINELEKYLLNESCDFEIITKHKKSILKFITEYKEEHYKKVMENGLYYLYLIFEKFENKEYLGICGWYPRPMFSWEKKLVI